MVDLWKGITPALNANSHVIDLDEGRDSTFTTGTRGTFTGTMTPQIRPKGATLEADWIATNVEDLNSATDAEVATITAPGDHMVRAPGYEFRLRWTAFTSVGADFKVLGNYGT
jgi:hypothetical protein